MKILIVCGYCKLGSFGGAEYQAFLLANALANRGHSVAFISIGDEDRIIIDNKIKIFSVKKRKLLRKFGPYFFLDYFKIKRIIKKFAPDAVYIRANPSYLGMVALILGKYNKKTKIIYHISSDQEVISRGINLNPTKFFYNIEILLKIIGYKRSIIICQTSYQSHSFYTRYKKKCHIVRNFHHISVLPPYQHKENIICWIGNIKAVKNPIEFIKMAKNININGLRFVMAGRPPSGMFRIEFFKHLEKSNVEYLGEISHDEVYNLLKRSKILCSTSFAEGFPNIFIEAWLHKVVVISLFVDPDGLLEAEHIGFKVNSIYEMAMKIKQLLLDEALLCSYAERAHDFAVRNFNIDQNIKKIIDIFEDRAIKSDE